MIDRDDLIVPVYLNQRIVFDFVAMLQGGIASVTSISQTRGESSEVAGSLSSRFGLSSALASLLRIDFSAAASGATANDSVETRSEQRIHTSASLFIALRAELRDKKFIVGDKDGVSFAPGDIVEFSASLKRNPLVETMGSLVALLDMSQAFSDAPAKGKTNRPNEDTKEKRQVQSFIEALTSSDTVDLITGPLESSHRAVITLEQQFLNDPTMSDLVDGTFKVVGKVTRVVSDSDDAISLNRKSAVGILPPSVLEDLKDNLSGPDLAGFGLPELEWEIPGPAIQVIPIAVFA